MSNSSFAARKQRAWRPSAVPALCLHLYGADDDHKVTLEIEDIRQQMFKDVPTRLRDLLDIATYVFAADQAVLRGRMKSRRLGPVGVAAFILLCLSAISNSGARTRPSGALRKCSAFFPTTITTSSLCR